MVTRGFRDLVDLVGEELGGVHFVRNYVELYFDGPLLRILSPPIVELPGRSWSEPDAGFRDALCSLIGTVVTEAREEKTQLVVRFAGGAAVLVPLAWHARVAEVAHFVPFFDGRAQVAEMHIWENQEPTWS